MSQKEPLDVTEVKTIIDNLQYLEKTLPPAIHRWKKQLGNNCDLAMGHMSKGTLKRLCENPSILHREIFAPLYSFLNTYIANREGRIAFTGKTLDSFLKKGLRAVQKYVVIADHFARNPNYFVPDVSFSEKGYAAYKAATVEQNKYKEFIFTVNEYLIGCKDKLNFMFLKLLSTVKNLDPELQQMKDYLDQQCISMRIARLNV